MASRKTYFGIGWPKDPAGSEPGAPSGAEAEDRSAPTVVDDEKVAEGLRQLRSWYQSDTPPERPEDDAMRRTPPPPAKTGAGARPTAVGHATAPAPPAVQRPVAPDPMRATMYGHDVHQFEFPSGAAEPTPTPQQPPPPGSTALVVADPAARQREALRQQAEADPGAAGPSPSDPFLLARFGQGEAERLHRPAVFQRPSAPPATSAISRVPMASRIVFGVGIAALLGAVAISVISNSGSDAPPAPAVAAPAPSRAAAPPLVPEQPLAPSSPATPTAGAPLQPGAPAAARPVAPPVPAPSAPLPVVALPKAPRPTPVTLKAPRRPREPKPAPPTEVDEAATARAATPPAAELPDLKDVALPAETRDPKAKDLLEIKDTKDLRDTKDVKDTRDVKDTKETKSLKEVRSPKEPKNRANDPDSTLPPSSLN